MVATAPATVLSFQQTLALMRYWNMTFSDGYDLEGIDGSKKDG